jgi:hypothetical protein
MPATLSNRALLERAVQLARELKQRHLWKPLPGPQTMAYNSTADVIGFGGAAGGGKTDLAVGLALMEHQRITIMRKEGTQLYGIIDRIAEIVGTRVGYSTQRNTWRDLGPRKVQIEFGSAPNPGDEEKQRGRPKDLLVIDEASQWLEAPIKFLMGWVRSTDPKQRKRVLMCFNPPGDAEGRWIIDYFAPWLDETHICPAEPGEIRWFATVNGKEVEVPTGKPFTSGVETIIPMSRTFIPSRITDNPYLMGTNYMATLQSMPEPLRSQMLYGDFKAGLKDNAMQVIPTEWVKAAQARWKMLSPKPEMDSMGIDVARGGDDNTIIARRHAMWFDEALVYAGKATPDGPTVAGLVVAANRNRAPMHLDVIGVGASPYDFLVQAKQPVLGVNVAESTLMRDKSGALGFANLRSALWWKMREALDPANNTGIALPPDERLLKDLCAPIWWLRGKAIQVEGREDIIKRIGRSPDWASAYLLALMDTPKTEQMVAVARVNQIKDHDPYA